MKVTVRQAVDEHQPRRLIIDFGKFEYTFGDWIAGPYIVGIGKLGANNVCLVAGGETACALTSLLVHGNMMRYVRLASCIAEAMERLG
jgi:hypothetical protein